MKPQSNAVQESIRGSLSINESVTQLAKQRGLEICLYRNLQLCDRIIIDEL